MKITDDVIRDLLPLYHAGEVRADTRALVEAWLQEHPALAEEALRESAWSLPVITRTGADAEEREALRRTKALLARRSWALGIAIFFTALPLSFGGGDRTGFHWFFWPDHALAASLSLALGAVAWIAYAINHRRLRPKGF
ncbi:MAG: hypothetical protein FJ280_13100 [Planctomycetes bacterium]|nr:hypothetical protein [Planctomycetota bacterium]